MEKDGACKMDRQNKNAIVLKRVGEGRIMLKLIKKRKRNLLRQKKISDDRQHYD